MSTKKNSNEEEEILSHEQQQQQQQERNGLVMDESANAKPPTSDVATGCGSDVMDQVHTWQQRHRNQQGQQQQQQSQQGFQQSQKETKLNKEVVSIKKQNQAADGTTSGNRKDDTSSKKNKSMAASSAVEPAKTTDITRMPMDKKNHDEGKYGEEEEEKVEISETATEEHHPKIQGETGRTSLLSSSPPMTENLVEASTERITTTTTAMTDIRPGAVAVGPSTTSSLSPPIQFSRETLKLSNRSIPPPSPPLESSMSSGTAKSASSTGLGVTTTPAATPTTTTTAATATPAMSSRNTEHSDAGVGSGPDVHVDNDSSRNLRQSSAPEAGTEDIVSTYPMPSEHQDAPSHNRGGGGGEEEDNELPTTTRTRAATTTASALPVAQEYQQLELVSAELVVPPTNAERVDVFNVDIDGSTAFVPRGDRSNGGGKDERDQKTRGRDDLQSRSLPSWLILIIVVLCIALALAIAIPVSRTRRSQKKGKDMVVPTPSPTFSYECYTSTLDIFTAQIEFGEDYDWFNNPFIVCPNTIIKIGTLRNPSLGDLIVINGDYPIHIMYPNITIQCGIDGSRSNECIMNGGLIQVTTQNKYSHPSYGTVYSAPSLDNVIIRGITFTGTVEGAGPFLGIPTAMSHPGKNIRFEDCAWINMTASRRVFWVGLNYVMQLQGYVVPLLSVEVTLSHCFFENVSYTEQFLATYNQILHLEYCTFQNIQLNTIIDKEEHCSLHPNGCRQLLHCQQGINICTISNLCVHNFEIASAAPIIISNETQWIDYGNHTWSGLLHSTRFDTTTINPATNEVVSFCDLDVARFNTDETSYTCLGGHEGKERTVFELVNDTSICGTTKGL